MSPLFEHGLKSAKKILKYLDSGRQWLIMVAMTSTAPTEYTLLLLEEATGVSARTIRYYISQGLLPPPLKVGCNASYSAVHVEALRRITSLKAQGVSLDEIRRRESPPTTTTASPWKSWCGEDVMVLVRQDVSPERRDQIEKARVVFWSAITRKITSEEG